MNKKLKPILEIIAGIIILIFFIPYDYSSFLELTGVSAPDSGKVVAYETGGFLVKLLIFILTIWVVIKVYKIAKELIKNKE